MTAEQLRKLCLALPGATEGIKWEHHLCFMVAKKMFAVANIEPSDEHFVAIKVTGEQAAELIEIEGIIPTPYMARNHWVTLQSGSVLRDREIEALTRGSYELIVAKLPKKTRAALEKDAGLRRAPKKKISTVRRPATR